MAGRFGGVWCLFCGDTTCVCVDLFGSWLHGLGLCFVWCYLVARVAGFVWLPVALGCVCCVLVACLAILLLGWGVFVGFGVCWISVVLFWLIMLVCLRLCMVFC